MSLKDDYLRNRNGDFSPAANDCLGSIILSGDNGRFRYKLGGSLHHYCSNHRLKCLARKVEGVRIYCQAMLLYDSFRLKK